MKAPPAHEQLQISAVYYQDKNRKSFCRRKPTPYHIIALNNDPANSSSLHRRVTLSAMTLSTITGLSPGPGTVTVPGTRRDHQCVAGRTVGHGTCSRAGICISHIYGEGAAATVGHNDIRPSLSGAIKRTLPQLARDG